MERGPFEATAVIQARNKELIYDTGGGQWTV